MDPESTESDIIDNTVTDPNADAAGREFGAVNEEGEPQEPESSETKPLDEDAIAEKIAQRWATHQAQLPQPEKQYTPEELDKIFQVWKPSPDLVTALREGDVEEAVKQIASMRDGMQKQFATVMTMTMQAELQKMRQEFGGVQAEANRLSAERSEKEFYAVNTDLNPKDPKHVRAARLAYNAVLSSGQKFADTKSASKAVADETRAILKDMGVSTVARNGNGNQPTTRMQPLARGGSGASRSGGPTATSGVSQALRELA